MLRHKKRRIWTLLFVISIPLALVLYTFLNKSGFIKPNDNSFISEAKQTCLIIISVLPVIVFRVLERICPECKRYIPYEYEKKNHTCPNCNAKL